MYALINQHIDTILGRIDGPKYVQPYLWLFDELRKRNVANDKEFQRNYRAYWAI